MSIPYDGTSVQQETAWHELLGGLDDKLSAEKFGIITKFFTFPLSVGSMANDIAQDLYKVFDARNAVFSIEYPHDRIKEIGDTMLASMDVRGWIESVGRNVLKCAPNTIVILDKDENGDILLIDLPNEKLEGYEFTKEGCFDYIVFEHSKGVDEQGNKWTKRGVYDDSMYRVYIQNESNKEYTFLFEEPHNLGSCPARFFYDKPLVNKQEFDRSIPFSPVRGSMEQWTIFDLFQYYQKHFASFQVVQYHQNACEDSACEGGYIYVEPRTGEDNKVISDGYNRECPTCAKNALIGPGSAIGVDISRDKEDQDARDIFKFVSPEMAPLEYIDKSQKAIESTIKENTVGYSDAVTSEAINETQVKALVESRKKPLLEIKHYLEGLYKWIVESSIKLVYDVDVKVNANYGTEWFILTVDELLDIITKAKAAGAQSTYIEQLNRQLIETEYKGNPHLAKRMVIAADVEPNAYDTQEESRKKHSEGMMSNEDYYIKSNFTDLLGQFVRDNGSIVMFGKDLPYSTKIDRIKATLLHYTKGKLTTTENGNSSNDNAQPIGTSESGT